jgi:hypothetical protein
MPRSDLGEIPQPTPGNKPRKSPETLFPGGFLMLARVVRDGSDGLENGLDTPRGDPTTGTPRPSLRTAPFLQSNG